MQHARIPRSWLPSVIYLLFVPVSCNANINKSSASHFGPVRVIKNPFALLTDPTSANVTQAPALLQTAQSPVRINSLLVYCPSLGSRTVLHVNVFLLFYPVARLFVLCLANCGLYSVLSSASDSYPVAI